MQVLITGVGDAFTARHYGSSCLIQAPNGLVQVDCPDPIHRVLHEAAQRASWSIQPSDICDVILTHLHGDHCNGLESFAFARRVERLKDPTRPKLRLHTTQAVIDRLWERLAPAMDAPFAGEPSTLESYFDLRVLVPGQIADIAGLKVECRWTGHPIPTIGLRLSGPDGTLGWSGDTPFEQAHIDWLAQADLIVHESNVPPAHTDIEDLNGLDPAIRARMRLVHLPDDFAAARTTIPRLVEGDVLQISKNH